MTDELQTLSDKLAAINAEAAQLQAKIAEQTAAERADALADIKQDIADFGIKPAELFSAGELRQPEKAEKRIKLRSVKAAVMYCNEAGLTWAGRGKRPTWLRAELMRGKSLSDFRVAA